MTLVLTQHDPLSTLPRFVQSDVFEIVPCDLEAKFNLRIRETEVDQAAEALRLALPRRMGELASAGACSAICVGPDEWLLSVPLEDAGAVRAAFANLAQKTPLSLVETTDRDCSLRVAGPKAAYALKAVCPHDVEAMSVGTATRTLFDHADLLVVRETATSFRLQVLRSWTPHVTSLLSKIGREVATGLRIEGAARRSFTLTLRNAAGDLRHNRTPRDCVRSSDCQFGRNAHER